MFRVGARAVSQVSVLARPSRTAAGAVVPTRSFAGQVKFQDGPFRSNAEDLVAKVDVIEVEGMTAVCNGGGGALGHPIEYIQLNTVTAGEIGECKYCGLRFIHAHKHH